MQTLISVIVPVYNVKPYLSDCLDSIVAQTYADLEIILVDDGSTDGSGELCDQYAKRDGRVRVIHQKNSGVSAARNAGLAASTGGYIGFVDADDWIDPSMYESLIGAIGDADIVCCGYMDYPMGTMEVAVPRGTRPGKACGVEEAVIYIYERHGYSTGLCNKLFRRQRLIREDQFIKMDPSLQFGEVEAWLAEALQQCESVAFLPVPLYYWRPRNESITRAKKLTDRHMTLLRSFKKVLSLLPQTENVQRLLKARFFNDFYYFKAQAYYTKDAERFHELSLYFKPLKPFWLKSANTPLIRKIKVLLMELEIKLRMPGKIVELTDRWKRYGFKK